MLAMITSRVLYCYTRSTETGPQNTSPTLDPHRKKKDHCSNTLRDQLEYSPVSSNDLVPASSQPSPYAMDKLNTVTFLYVSKKPKTTGFSGAQLRELINYLVSNKHVEH